jgi:hypothetical protein
MVVVKGAPIKLGEARAPIVQLPATPSVPDNSPASASGDANAHSGPINQGDAKVSVRGENASPGTVDPHRPGNDSNDRSVATKPTQISSSATADEGMCPMAPSQQPRRSLEEMLGVDADAVEDHTPVPWSEKGGKIAAAAEKRVGSTDYGVWDSPRAYGVVPTNKCNQFAYDVLKHTGNAPPLETRSPSWSMGSFTVAHPPTAQQWAASSHPIPGFSHQGIFKGSELKSVVQPGDIISNGIHMGIAGFTPGQTVSAATSGEVVNNDWGYRRSQEHEPFAVVRADP